MIAAAAPAILESAPVVAPAVGATAGPLSPASASGFDAILLLQGFGATPEMLAEAGLESGDTELLTTEDSDEEDGEEDLEASLAFLANLIAVTAQRGSPGDPGAGGQGMADDDNVAPLSAAALSADVGLALAEDADKAEAQLALAATDAELLDRPQQAGDTAQNLARAAELLNPAQRAAADISKQSLATHVRDPRWAEDFSSRISLMVRAGESRASLQLTPVDLGPMEVSVSVKDSQATIHFGASQADTRALIEASLPRLREMLAAQGFSLMDASVSSGFSRSASSGQASGGRAGEEGEAASVEPVVVRQMSLLDIYA